MTNFRKFCRNLENDTKLLTCNSYMNFLRFYKSQHPRYGLRRILQNGFQIWINYDHRQKRKFKQKNILTNTNIKPRLKWRPKKAVTKLPRKRLPRSFRKRDLNAVKNIERRKRNKRKYVKYGKQKFPGHFN
ncbi:deadbeat [Cochliomyia hominivorax]